MIRERITMLGTTGAGKTCFLVGMYADMSGGRRGFTFSTNPDDDLDLSNKWSRLVEAGRDRWPPLTVDQPKSYTFGFNYGFRRIMEFDWIDYRGGALSIGRSTEADVQELKRYLRQSSYVMLCVSGEHLQVPKNAAVVRAQTGIGSDEFGSFLTELREEIGRQKKELPAVIIVVLQSPITVPNVRMKRLRNKSVTCLIPYFLQILAGSCLLVLSGLESGFWQRIRKKEKLILTISICRLSFPFTMLSTGS